MILSLSKQELRAYTKRQLEIYIPDDYRIDSDIISWGIEKALEKCENCFSHIAFPGFRNEKKEAVFSHLHMDQYATYLYYLENLIWTQYQEKQLCDKLMNLNKILNGFYISYKCKMPDIFFLDHPVGSVIGNAQYSDGLVILQDVTINTSSQLKIGKGCFLAAGAKIIGDKSIGDRCSIGVGAVVYNEDIPDDSVCIMKEGKTFIRKRKNKLSMAEKLFDGIEF